jgi:hypothetical protein
MAFMGGHLPFSSENSPEAEPSPAAQVYARFPAHRKTVL